MTEQPRFIVASAMKDEGAFLIEWAAWYRMLGFYMLVVTNDCGDPTPQMLNILHDAGWLTHITCSPDPGAPPKRAAHRALREHALIETAEWLLLCDVDEFLVLHGNAGGTPMTIGPWLDRLADRHGPGIEGVAFHWKVFGSGGAARWQDGLQHRMATHAARTRDRANSFFKSLIRRPARFAHIGTHSPLDFHGDWDPTRMRWIDCNGRTIAGYHPDGPPKRATDASRVTHATAQLNHYILRNAESFALKRGTLSPAALVDRYTDAFWDKFDRNEEEDTSALAYVGPFDATYAGALALPGLARLHHLSCAHYAARLAAVTGTRPQDDPRWRHHMDQAGDAGSGSSQPR